MRCRLKNSNRAGGRSTRNVVSHRWTAKPLDSWLEALSYRLRSAWGDLVVAVGLAVPTVLAATGPVWSG